MLKQFFQRLYLKHKDKQDARRIEELMSRLRQRAQG